MYNVSAHRFLPGRLTLQTDVSSIADQPFYTTHIHRELLAQSTHTHTHTRLKTKTNKHTKPPTKKYISHTVVA